MQMADKSNAKEQSSEMKGGQQQQPNQQSTATPIGQGRRHSGLSRRGRFPSLLRPIDLLMTNPFDLMRRFTEELDQAFGTGLSGQTAMGQTAMATPAVDIFEREGNIVVQADLPGLKADQVKVEITDDGIVIRGESQEEQEQRGENFYRCERSHGQFYRLIPLPEHADADRAQARFNDGMLEVTIPAAEPRRKSREIPVESQATQSQAASGHSKG
jgi:HSP20 family protein